MRTGAGLLVGAALLVALLLALLVTTLDYDRAVEACFPHRVIWVGEERAYCGLGGWRDLP